MPFFKIKIVWKLIIKNNIFILELFHQNFESHLACLCLLFFWLAVGTSFALPIFQESWKFFSILPPTEEVEYGQHKLIDSGSGSQFSVRMPDASEIGSSGP